MVDGTKVKDMLEKIGRDPDPLWHGDGDECTGIHCGNPEHGWENTDKSLVSYTSHTFTCFADMTKEMILSKTEDEKESGIRPERFWFLDWTCTCGLRDILKANELDEKQIGTADYPN